MRVASSSSRPRPRSSISHKARSWLPSSQTSSDLTPIRGILQVQEVSMSRRTTLLALAALVLMPLASCSGGGNQQGGKGGRIQLLNVSYDPTRELYKAVNSAFAAKWKADT